MQGELGPLQHKEQISPMIGHLLEHPIDTGEARPRPHTASNRASRTGFCNASGFWRYAFRSWYNSRIRCRTPSIAVRYSYLEGTIRVNGRSA